MTILVTGANGQLGNEMRIASRASDDRYIFTDVCDINPESIEMLRKLVGEEVDVTVTKLDITNLDALLKVVKDNDVDVIVNCAAYTNVDAAESNQDLAELLNAKAPENLAVAIKSVGGLLVHISTDYVFGFDPYNTPCKEDQKGTPAGVYGLTKLLGEQAIERVGCNAVILRTSWLYSEFGKNFVKTMLSLTAIKSQLKVVFDQVGTPTYALDLANAIVAIIENYKVKAFNSQFPIFNYSNEGVCSWFDFAKMIAEYAGKKACDIQPCHSNEFPSPVKRPAYSVLEKTRIKETFGITIPYWTDSLKVCIKNLEEIKR